MPTNRTGPLHEHGGTSGYGKGCRHPLRHEAHLRYAREWRWRRHAAKLESDGPLANPVTCRFCTLPYPAQGVDTHEKVCPKR